MARLHYLLLLGLLAKSALLIGQEPITSAKLLEILRGKDAKVDYVLANADKFHFQLILTTYSFEKEKTQLIHADINKDQYYFLPASLIKLPAAVLAAEKMSSLQELYNITTKDSIVLDPCPCNQATINYVKSTQPSTFDQILREMLILSNNSAYNFIFDLLGKDSFNTRIRQIGYDRINLRNRFYSSCLDDQQSWFGGIRFYGPDNILKYQLPCQRSQRAWLNDSNWPHQAGLKYVEGRRLVSGPKNYISGNYVSLWSAHRLLIQLIENGKDGLLDTIKLNKEIREELINALGSYPRELNSKRYNNEYFPDTYYKFFLDPSSMRTGKGELRIYNKVGIAGGFISDVSFFHDERTGLKFFISGSMMAVENGIIDYRRYKYYDIGIPVFRKIGQILYEYLLNTLPDDRE